MSDEKKPFISNEEIRADEIVQRAEQAIRDAVDEYGIDVLFEPDGAKLLTRLGQMRLTSAFKIRKWKMVEDDYE